MKKNKILAAIMLSMLFVVSTIMTAFAAPSPEATPTRPVAAVDKDGKDVKDSVSITTPSKDEFPEGTASDEAIKEATGTDATAISTVKIDVPDGTTTNLTIDAPGVKEGDSVAVLVYDEATKKLKKIPAVAGDNVVSFELDQDAIVTIVVLKAPSYTLTGPDVWTIGSNVEFMMKSDADFEKFVEVKIDGKVVDAANYEAKKGSTEIYMKAAYLDTLALGDHEFTVVSNDGSASKNFKVVEATSSNPGGDVTPVRVLVVMAVISMLVAAGLMVVKSKKAN